MSDPLSELQELADEGFNAFRPHGPKCKTCRTHETGATWHLAPIVQRLRDQLETKWVPLATVLADFKDGDEHGWDEEFAFLRTVRATHIAKLTADIAVNGIRLPILLGDDQRVWDGHHRLCVASALEIQVVPVRTFAEVTS